MMVGMFDNQKDWEIAAQMGEALWIDDSRGWMHTVLKALYNLAHQNNTLLNATTKLGVLVNGNLNGHLFVSSGLGEMRVCINPKRQR